MSSTEQLQVQSQTLEKDLETSEQDSQSLPSQASQASPDLLPISNEEEIDEFTPNVCYLADINHIEHSLLNIKLLNDPKPTHLLPSKVDLRDKMPPVYNQGKIGSCSANAIVAAFQYDTNNAFYGSRLFCYYNERLIEHTTEQDAGALISDGMKSIQQYGLCSEATWPYIEDNFDDAPPSTGLR